MGFLCGMECLPLIYNPNLDIIIDESLITYRDGASPESAEKQCMYLLNIEIN